MSTHRHIRRRESFDEVAELYDRARPGYPQRLIDDLVALTDLDKRCRVLEIGSGTGQLTVPLAERGLSVVAVELGSSLAEIARRKLAPFEHAEVVVADFVGTSRSAIRPGRGRDRLSLARSRPTSTEVRGGVAPGRRAGDL